MNLITAAHTHVGRRDSNEDSCCADPRLGLFAVADGMGGYEGGEIASRLAIDAVLELVRRDASDDDATWPYAMRRDLTADENLVAVAARLAHDRICVRRVGRLARMGSTLAMLVVRDGRAIVGHIGDSRVYLLRGGQLLALTRDHSCYEELRAAGITDVSRDEFPHRNMITRALGIEGAPDVRTIPTLPGDVFLLCTDGLTDAVGEDDIARLVADRDAEVAARALVDAAYDAGGRDNITAVVVRCEDRR